VSAETSIPVKQKGVLGPVSGESFEGRKSLGNDCPGPVERHEPSKASLPPAPPVPASSPIADEAFEQLRNRQPTTPLRSPASLFSLRKTKSLHDYLIFEEEEKDPEEQSLAADDEEDQSMKRRPRETRQA